MRFFPAQGDVLPVQAPSAATTVNRGPGDRFADERMTVRKVSFGKGGLGKAEGSRLPVHGWIFCSDVLAFALGAGPEPGTSGPGRTGAASHATYVPSWSAGERAGKS